MIGAARLHTAADADLSAERTWARSKPSTTSATCWLPTVSCPVHRVDPDDAGWDAYLARTAQAAADWAVAYPGPRADRWIEEQADWQAARERDRDVIGWSLWIARASTIVSA